MLNMQGLLSGLSCEPPLETEEEARVRKVRDAIAGLRANLQRDGGDVELVGVEGNIVRVKLAGACLGCQLAFMTIHGIQVKLIAKLGMPLRVVPVLHGG